MDTRKIAELLRATIDPNQQQQAEEQLTQVHAHVVPYSVTWKSLNEKFYDISKFCDSTYTLLGSQNYWVCPFPASGCDG